MLPAAMTMPRKTIAPKTHPSKRRGRPDCAILLQLTPREAEVLAWLIEGKRDAEIGAILEISENTVHKHAQRIYAKLGVETRTAAARVATAAGFEPFESRR